MHRTALVASLLIAALSLYPARAADSVQPQSISINNLRGVASGTQASATEFYQSSTLLFTNCVAYTGTNTASAVQGLDAVTVQLTLGNSAATTTVATATVDVASNGTWWCAITIPTLGASYSCYGQVKLTDAQTNSYIYPWFKILTKEAL
jgi:hypothetical protein